MAGLSRSRGDRSRMVDMPLQRQRQCRRARPRQRHEYQNRDNSLLHAQRNVATALLQTCGAEVCDLDHKLFVLSKKVLQTGFQGSKPERIAGGNQLGWFHALAGKQQFVGHLAKREPSDKSRHGEDSRAGQHFA